MDCDSQVPIAYCVTGESRMTTVLKAGRNESTSGLMQQRGWLLVRFEGGWQGMDRRSHDC